jgi:hypothetical protein
MGNCDRMDRTPSAMVLSLVLTNAAGVAAIGAVFFAIESSQPSRLALLAALALFALSMIACDAFPTWMRRVTG